LVDIDTDLKNATYLNLKFGDVKGRITWDDDPNNLIFSEIEARKNDTPYKVSGTLFLGPSDSIAMNVAFPSGNIRDVSSIFENLVSGLWWYPKTMSGPFQGTAKLSGGISLSQLSVIAQLSGNNWQFMGERAKSINLKGGYVRGDYILSEVNGVKENGRFSGRITYSADKKFDWELKTQNFSIADVDHIARMDVPFRGKFEFESRGRGKAETLQSVTLGALNDFSVRGRPLPPSQLSIRTDGGVANAKVVALGGQGIADLAYNLNSGAASSLKAELRHLDFSPMILLLNPKLMQDPELDGYVSGDLKLGFNSGEIERATGGFSVQEYHLAKTGAIFHLNHPVSVKVQAGDFNLKDLSVSGNSGAASLNLRGNPDGLNGTVGGQLDLSILEFLTPTISRGAGVADLGFTIGGLLKAPSIYGRADIKNGQLKIPSIDSPFENISGSLNLKDGNVIVQNLQCDLGGGRVVANGSVDIYADRYPALDLKANLTGNRLRIYPFQYVKLRGAMGVTGDDRPYLVSGSLVADGAVIHEKVMGQKQNAASQSLLYTPSASGRSGATESDLPLFKLKIDVAAERGIMVQNDLFDAEMKAHVSVVNTLAAPRILGSAEIVQGKLSFKDRQFQIQSAAAKFDNPAVIDPTFNMTATTDVGSTKVQLYASGRPSNIKLDFTSNPAMSEPDILSLLALGSGTLDNRNKFAGVGTDRSQVQQGEAASLLLQSMDFNRDLQDKTGFEIQLDETVNPLQGQSIFNAKSPTEQTAQPKIVVRRRIGNRLSLSYGSTVGVGANKQNDFNAELQLTPGFSAIGVYENYETQEETRKDTQSSYGIDLKVQKRFK
jgi:translocation and assembly module TamB